MDFLLHCLFISLLQGAYMHVMVHVWRTKDNSQMSVLLFYHVCPKDGTSIGSFIHWVIVPALKTDFWLKIIFLKSKMEFKKSDIQLNSLFYWLWFRIKLVGIFFQMWEEVIVLKKITLLVLSLRVILVKQRSIFNFKYFWFWGNNMVHILK